MANADTVGAGGGGESPCRLRLAPDMVSLRLLVLAFVKGYIGRWGASPSYGEIAEATGSNRTRVKQAVRKLEADGQLLRVHRAESGGRRVLALPEQRHAAAQFLSGLGWTVSPPTAAPATTEPDRVTNHTLEPFERLHYDPATGTRFERIEPLPRRPAADGTIGRTPEISEDERRSHAQG